MSDLSQGPGWWLASDGKWYPPGQATVTVPQGAPDPVISGPGPGSPSAQGVPGGPVSTNPGPADPEPTPGPPAAPSTSNKLAVASLVSSFFFWFWGAGAILAIVFGLIARWQIRQSGGTQRGRGIATAGIILGCAAVVFAGILVALGFTLAHHHCHHGHCPFPPPGTGGH